MTDLTNRLSKAVWEYLDTATLRSEPFSLSRIEEVIAGVMATERKVPVGVVRHPEYLAQKTAHDTAMAERQRAYTEKLLQEPVDAERAALEQYWATIRGRTV